MNETLQSFYFFSEGPKGKFRKFINFTLYNSYGTPYFNLGFGDWDEEKMEINDTNVTDNSDRQKILATIAAAVLFFTEYFPDIYIHAKGSTPVRTRLYQMGISANWDEIEPLLHVYGYLKGKWHRFKKNTNDEAFLILRK